MSEYRILDIETVPDERWTPPERWQLAASAFTPALIDPPARVVFPAGVEAADPFPPPQMHKVVAMAWVDLTSDDGKWYHYDKHYSACAYGKGDAGVALEREMLAKFGEAQSGDAATIVTWNGRGFDLPVINLRSMGHKLQCKWYYEESDLRYRYTEAMHCDVMDSLCDYGAVRGIKLDEMAKICGLPGKVGEVTGNLVGAKVAEYARSGNAEILHDVRRYCLADALQTALIFLRSRFHKGMIDAGQHDVALATFVPFWSEMFPDWPLMSRVGVVG